jgi:Ca2+-binding EF-hand superfamily protein
MEAIGAITAVQAGVGLLKSILPQRKPAQTSPFSAQMNESFAARAIQQNDHNGDGVLSRAETSLNKNLFKQLDSNRDGVLDQNEIQSGANILKKYHAQETRFHALDMNENKSLSPNESGLSMSQFRQVDMNSNKTIQLAEWLNSGDSA